MIVCFITRAIHLELTTGQTCDAFLQSFNRFVSRRGQPSCIYSDNAKTFICAAEYLTKFSIDWRFSPPRGPHHGGLWEAVVKSTKSHLLRVTKGHARTFEQYTTLFTQIEGILNSRPLCVRRVGEQDDVVITPGHLVTGRYLLSTPELDNEPTGLPTEDLTASRWIEHQKTLRSFWKVWSSDYLNQMQLRERWHQETPNLAPGQVVAVKDETLEAIGRWPRARIEEVYPDPDGLIRKVKIHVAGKSFIRPVTKIIQLPVMSD